MAERKPSDEQAAFGVFPQLKRNRSKQDREAAKNVPVDLARGAVAGVLGAPGDIESLVRMLPYIDEKTILPTSEDIEKKLPFRSDTPVSRAATGLGTLGGGFYYGPGSPLKVVGALPRAIKHGAEEFAKASVAGAPHVVKPTGGNWLNRTVENELLPLRQKVGYSLDPEAQLKKLSAKYTPETIASLEPNARADVQRMLKETADSAALNKWIDSNLTNYVKKQMATPDDPVRKLAEQDITAFPIAEDPRFWNRMGESGRGQMEGTQMAQSDLAKQWENRADAMIGADTAQQHQDMMHLAPGMYEKADEFIKKLPPETPLYKTQGAGSRFDPRDLGFDHIIDVLKQDVAAGRLRSDQLNKVSMEQAVRRTYEFDQEMARKMRDAALKQTEGFPTHKEYPEGYKWIELAKPSPAEVLPEGWSAPVAKGNALQTRSQNGDIVLGFDMPDLVKNIYKRHPDTPGNPYTALEDALKYEGETMGHCVGGYCPDVLSGNTRIFSLRDAKGEPHVTIETRPNPYAPRWDDVKPYMAAATEEAKKLPNGYTGQDISDIAVRMAKENMPENIVQIKGKQNAKPKDQYLPFVQDFVQGGNWGDVGDIKNTGLLDLKKSMIPWPEGTQAEQIDRLLGGMADGTKTPMYKSNEEFFNKAQQELGKKYVTKQEYQDWLSKQINPDVPPAEGMKRGGKVSISNNPDTMMLEVNNRKMAKGGKAVKFVEDVAPAAMEKLAMMFGNKLPLNMNAAEVENLAKRFPEPVVDRVNMAHKDVLKRTPELQEAAARIDAGDMSADEYARLVQRYKPVTPYESVPAPASREEILAALAKTSREAEGLPRKETYFGRASSTLKEGDPVGLRLDIPSYNQANTWVVTAHGPRKSPVSGGAGTRIGYEPVAMATDVDFSVSPKAALGIAKGAEKNTIATMEGKWKPTNPDEAFTLAKQYLKNPEWRQVGMDPERHSFFYDRETMAPVINAEEVIQIGPLVLAKNPKYGNPKDFKYASGGLAHMKEGGSEDDAKPYFGGAGTKKYAAAKKRAEQADVNLLKDPKTYAAVASFMGEAPDQLGFSVLHPDAQGIKEVADPAFYAGTALGVAPLMKVFNAPAMALGRAGERYADKVVPQIMERGGLGAEILGGLAQGSRSHVYLPHTEKKPNPNVGSRFKTEHVGNLAPKHEFDIEANQDSSVMVNPWDLTSRGEKVLEVSDTPLIEPIITEGGHDFARDLAHINENIGGASGRQIAERMQDRVNDAYFANMLDKGTGRVFTMPSTMDVTGSNYSTMPTDVIMDFFKQAELNPKDVGRITDDLRTFMFETERGKFKNAAPVGSPEFLKQLREGGQGFSAGDLRKGFMDRMSKSEYQKMLGYNIEDVYGAIHDPALKGVPKGFVGNTMIETSPFAEIRPSTHQSYDSANAGKYAGSMPSMPIELMMPDLYEYLERQVLSSPKPSYKEMTPMQIRTMIINMLEKRGSMISQPINQRVVDNVMRYKEGLKQGHFKPNDYDSIMEFMRRTGGYKEGGAVDKPAEGGKQPAAYIDGSEFVEAAKKYGIKDSMNNLNKIVDLVNKGLTVDDAARQVADSGMHKAAGGAINGDDLILEERPL